jgi:hypothetical protein
MSVALLQSFTPVDGSGLDIDKSFLRRPGRGPVQVTHPAPSIFLAYLDRGVNTCADQGRDMEDSCPGKLRGTSELRCL